MNNGNGLVESTSNETELNQRVGAIVNLLDLGKIPNAVKEPGTTVKLTDTYDRSPKIKAWIIASAAGRCEACGMLVPFKTPEGAYYLEVHHMKPLGSKGSDSVSNALAVCPNCHKHFHFSEDREVFMDFIYKKIERLKKE